MASQSINQSINESSVPLQEIASTQSSALYVFVLHIATYSLLKVLTLSLPWVHPWPFSCYFFFIKTLFTNLSSSTCSSFSPHAFCFAFTTSGTASCLSVCCFHAFCSPQISQFQCLQRTAPQVRQTPQQIINLWQLAILVFNWLSVGDSKLLSSTILVLPELLLLPSSTNQLRVR